MAFVAVVPAVGTGIATIGGLGSSALAGLGSLASSIPVLGSVAAPALTGLGGAVGSLGAGLGGSLMGGGLGALTGGLGGAANALLGSGATAGGLGSGLLGMGSGLGGLYSGADKLVGGLLPNLGIQGTVTPAQGALGMAFPQVFGGSVATPPIVPPGSVGGIAGAGAGIGGMPVKGGVKDNIFDKLIDGADKAQGLMAGFNKPSVTPQAAQFNANRSQPTVVQNGGGMGGKRNTGIYGDRASASLGRVLQ